MEQPSDADSVGAMFDSGLMVAGTVLHSHSDYFCHLDEVGTVDYFCIGSSMDARNDSCIVQEAGAEENGDHEGAEEIMVEITTSDAGEGEMMTVSVEITHMDGDAVEHVNYDVMATQGWYNSSRRYRCT